MLHPELSGTVLFYLLMACCSDSLAQKKVQLLHSGDIIIISECLFTSKWKPTPMALLTPTSLSVELATTETLRGQIPCPQSLVFCPPKRAISEVLWPSECNVQRTPAPWGRPWCMVAGSSVYSVLCQAAYVYERASPFQAYTSPSAQARLPGSGSRFSGPCCL